MTDTARRGVRVPDRRLSRLSRFGGLAGGIAGRMAVAGMREVARGRRPDLRGLFLTPGNVERLTEELSRMRGAAMKVGQLLSMETGDVLPPELTDILARLRADAHHMPPRQLKAVLVANWGEDFLRRFRHFDVRPIAAASIGQVHRAQTRDERDLAIKVQYPGIRASIDSDIANVAALVRLSGLAPPGLDLAPILDEARRQLHDEADYRLEGRWLSRFAALLDGDPAYRVPRLHDDLTTPDILAMDYLEAAPLDALADAPQTERDRVARQLIALVLREVFDFRLMQTDPNFANYRYDRATGALILLDFGATRAFGADLSEGYRSLLRAGLAADRAAMAGAAMALGLFGAGAAPRHRESILGMMDLAFGPLRQPGSFDFATGDLAPRLREAGLALAADGSYAHVPPADTLFLQRKVGGMYLLATQLRARLDLSALVAPYAAPARAA